MSEPIVVAKIRKSAVSEVWVVVKEYNGKRLCDVREYFHPGDSPDWLPTKKGASIPADLLALAVDAAEELSLRETVGEVRRLPRSNRAMLRFAICEYEKHIYGEIRTYYLEQGQRERWKPGKGVTLPLSMLGPLADAVRLAEDHMNGQT